MSGRPMNWGAPMTSETAYPDSEQEIYRIILGISLFGNNDELAAWLDYNSCCMLESEPEKLTQDELLQCVNYTDGFTMRFLANFPPSPDLPNPFGMDKQGICIGTDMYMECVLSERDGLDWKTYLMNSYDDLNPTIRTRAASGFYGEITKHGS